MNCKKCQTPSMTRNNAADDEIQEDVGEEIEAAIDSGIAADNEPQVVPRMTPEQVACINNNMDSLVRKTTSVRLFRIAKLMRENGVGIQEYELEGDTEKAKEDARQFYTQLLYFDHPNTFEELSKACHVLNYHNLNEYFIPLVQSRLRPSLRSVSEISVTNQMLNPNVDETDGEEVFETVGIGMNKQQRSLIMTNLKYLVDHVSNADLRVVVSSMSDLIPPDRRLYFENTPLTNSKIEEFFSYITQIQCKDPYMRMAEAFMRNVHVTSILSQYNPRQNIAIHSGAKSISVKEAYRMDLDANRKFNWKEVYKCLSNPKGSALVLNIYSYPHHKLDEKERKGSEHDTSHMTELLNELGFQVTNVPKYPESLKEEITAEMFKGAIRNFAQSIDHYHADVCFMVIMAHGEQLKSSGNAISCSDGKSVPLTWIHSQFSSMECKYLIGKPKVFFYQICRGSHSQDPQVDQYNLEVTAERSSTTLDCTDHEDTAFESPKNLVRMLDDMLVCHAAPQGFEALRDREVGSVFIQTIIEVFVEMAHDTHVQRMMVEVDRRIKKKSNGTFSQTTTYESIGFNKVLYLHPHLYRKTEEEPEEGACGVTENAGTSDGGDCLLKSR